MSIARTLTTALAFAGALSLVACDGGNKPNAKEPPASGAVAAKDGDGDSRVGNGVAKAGDGDSKVGNGASKASADGGGEKVKVVEGGGGDDRYALQIEPPAEAKAGEEGTAIIKVVPKEPWHMNLDYPTSLKLEAPEALAVTNADLKKGDAKLDESTCEFAVSFKPTAAGDHSVSGKFKFAVCKDEACSPVTEEVEFKVAVK